MINYITLYTISIDIYIYYITFISSPSQVVFPPRLPALARPAPWCPSAAPCCRPPCATGRGSPARLRRRRPARPPGDVDGNGLGIRTRPVWPLGMVYVCIYGNGLYIYVCVYKSVYIYIYIYIYICKYVLNMYIYIHKYHLWKWWFEGILWFGDGSWHCFAYIKEIDGNWELQKMRVETKSESFSSDA